MQVKLTNLGGPFSQLLSANRSCMCEEKKTVGILIYRRDGIYL